MPLYVKDQEVSELADRLAAMRGLTKTEAVRQALQNEIAKAHPSRVEQALAIGERLREMAGPHGLPADKAFIDSLYEDD